MRFYTNQHPFYCGIDLHARSMYVCIVSHDGEIRLHRNMQAAPEPFLKAIAPYRDGLVVAVECIFTWYWLADLCVQEGMAFVLGHALYMKAIHGGKAKNDQIDSQKIAALLRGGMLPQAYVYPAEMRATRDLLRRRTPLMRIRAELLAHVQHTNSQDTLPEIGTKIADKTNRDGVAERCEEAAVQKTRAVALALMTHDDEMRRALARFILHTAQPHEAQPLSLFHTVPGIGTILSLVLRYAIHDIDRFPRVQDCASSCRLVTCAKEAGGKRRGTSGNTIGTAPLQWAVSEAATLCLRGSAPGQQSRARLEKKHDQGKAVRMLAHQRARAVSSRLQRHTACDLAHFLQTSGSRAGAPGAERDPKGMSLSRTAMQRMIAASWHAEVCLGPISLSPAR